MEMLIHVEGNFCSFCDSVSVFPALTGSKEWSGLFLIVCTKLDLCFTSCLPPSLNCLHMNICQLFPCASVLSSVSRPLLWQDVTACS